MSMLREEQVFSISHLQMFALWLVSSYIPIYYKADGTHCYCLSKILK